MYVALLVGRTPKPTSVAIINGRIYKDSPILFGTQPASCLTKVSTVSKNSASGISGKANRLAELAKRLEFASGRKSEIEPSGWRYAFIPSKIS